MDSWFEATLRLPRISQFTDEEMQQHFWCLDGRWSQQTKNLVLKYAASGLHLNRNWAFTPQWWACPACRRDKQSIVRLTRNGSLFACLDVHHDHLRDYIDRMFGAVARVDGEAPSLRGRVELSAKRLAERFSDVTVCVDCNAADGAAKALLVEDIDKSFSFSPQEISQFIVIEPNRPHEIREAVAGAIWDSQKVRFDRLKSLASELLDMWNAGTLRTEFSFGDQSAALSWLRPNHFLNSAFNEAVGLSPTLQFDTYSNFVSRSTINETSSRAGSKRKVSPRPTDAEYLSIDAEMSKNFKEWRVAPTDWRCACCERSKPDLPRKSKSGQWTARIYGFEEYVVERDGISQEFRCELYPAYRSDPMIGAIVHRTVCQDCYLILTQVKTRRPDLGGVYLSCRDIKDCISSVEVNSLHECDLLAAEKRAEENRPFYDAGVAFMEHRQLSNEALDYYQSAQKSGWPDSDSRRIAAERLAGKRRLGKQMLVPYFDWLIKEGMRLRWSRTN